MTMGIDWRDAALNETPSRLLSSLEEGFRGETTMHAITNVDIVTIQPLVALIFGVLILIFPRILNYLVAAYLILIGAIGLWPHFFEHHLF